MKKRIIPILLSVLIVFCSLPFTAFADATPTVVVENYTVAQGGLAYIYLRADNFVNVAVLDIEVFYDSDAMSIYYVSNNTFFNSASVSTNSSTPGRIKISAMSATGLNSGTSIYTNRMMTICFKVNANCPVGDYPVVATIGDAYDGDLNPYAISGSNCKISVTAAAASAFTIYGDSAPTVKSGETWNCKVWHSSSSTYDFASADFRVEYDRDQFTVESVELATGLKKDTAVYSINTSIQGLIIISYASTTAIRSSDLFTVKLKAIATEPVDATVKVTASDVYNNDLIAFASSTVSKTVSISVDEVAPDYPNLYLSADNFAVGKQTEVAVMLEKDAPIAAGDFTVTYDPTVFRCDSVVASEMVAQKGAMVMINNKFDSGTIKFSYVNQHGAEPEEMSLVIINLTPIVMPSAHFSMTVEGTDLCDISFADQALENVGLSDCIFAVSITPPTCSEGGFSTYTCSCGESYVADNTPKLEHDFSGDWLDDLTHHFKECENCYVVDETTKATHTYTNSEIVCDTCGHNRGISSIAVTTLPQKTEYTQYIDDIDVTGAKVTVYYDDGNEKVLDLTDKMVSGFDKNTLGKQTVTVEASGHKTSFEVNVSAYQTAPHKKLYRIGLIEPWRLRICARMTDNNANTLNYSTFTEYGAYVIRKSQLCDIDTDLATITPDQLIGNENTVAYTNEDGMYVDGNYLCVDFNKEIYTYRLNEPIVWMMYYKTADGTYCTGIFEKTLLELIEDRKDSTSTTYTELEKKVYKAMYELYNTVTDYRNDFDSPSLIKMQTPPNLNSTEVEFTAPATDGLVKFKRLQQIRLVEPWGIVLNMRAYLSKDEGNSNAHIDYDAVDDYGIVVYHDVNGNIKSSETMDEWQEITSYSDSENVYVFNNLHGDMQLNGKYAYALYNNNIFTYQLDSEIYYMFFVKYNGQMYYSTVYATNIKSLTAERAESTSSTYTAKEKLVYRDMVAMCDAITKYREDYFANH